MTMNESPRNTLALRTLALFCRVEPRTIFFLSCFAVLALIMSCLDALAQTGAEDIGRTIEQKQTEMQTHERLLRGLSQQERQLFGDMQQVEERIRKTEREVVGLEKELATLRQTEKSIQEEYRQLDQARSQTAEELRKLLVALWPVHLRGLEHNVQNLGAWDEADRQFAWLGRVYGMVRERMVMLQIQGRELALAQVRAEDAKKRIADQMDRVNAAKDDLLAQKLGFLHRVQEVRAQKISAEEQLKDILQTITELNYQLKLLTTKKFTDFKGQMPWPGHGNVVEGYRPKAEPPHRGVSMAMAENAFVHAISWGKVVHSDTLRGYGHVVIIFHGEDYYSLYAFLSNVQVRVGQEVEKDERIGAAGYYPKVNGPGLYFELRFHQNPVNPNSWLVAK
ncbi:MAG TPA: peptidase M23 [Desulfonatronum sp.]|nr:peptidase M23 [Desulfonatronum sp.]